MHLPLSSSTVLFAGALFGISPPRCSRGGRRQARREHGRAESPLSGPKHGANAHHAGRQQQKPWVVGLARICCGVDVTSLFLLLRQLIFLCPGELSASVAHRSFSCSLVLGPAAPCRMTMAKPLCTGSKHLHKTFTYHIHDGKRTKLSVIL